MPRADRRLFDYIDCPGPQVAPNMNAVILWNTLGMLLFGLDWVIALMLALQADTTHAPWSA